MIPLRILAAAALAAGGLALAPGAQAAPNFAVAAPLSAEIAPAPLIRVADRDDWRRDRDRRGEWRRDRDRDDDRRDWRRGDDRRDWRRDDDRRDWRRDGRRDDHARRGDRDRRWDRDRRDYKKGHPVWKKRADWRAKRHPRHSRWIGRPFHHHRVVVIHNYRDYYLPAPRRGHYYARIDNDVFLVAAATRSIIDAFVLFDAGRR